MEQQTKQRPTSRPKTASENNNLKYRFTKDSRSVSRNKIPFLAPGIARTSGHSYRKFTYAHAKLVLKGSENIRTLLICQ